MPMRYTRSTPGPPIRRTTGCNAPLTCPPAASPEGPAPSPPDRPFSTGLGLGPLSARGADPQATSASSGESANRNCAAPGAAAAPSRWTETAGPEPQPESVVPVARDLAPRPTLRSRGPTRPAGRAHRKSTIQSWPLTAAVARIGEHERRRPRRRRSAGRRPRRPTDRSAPAPPSSVSAPSWA